MVVDPFCLDNIKVGTPKIRRYAYGLFNVIKAWSLAIRLSPACIDERNGLWSSLIHKPRMWMTLGSAHDRDA